MYLDLNLLTALDALLEEGSVAAAADRLHLSSPAMSRTLGRIRRTTGDQILVRTGRTMTPTPYALEIRAQVRDLVQQAESVLAPDRALDLAELDRVFTVICHDAITTALGPRLIAAVHRDAPNARLRLLAEGRADTQELRRGQVDLELGSAAPDSPEIRSELFFEDRLVLAVAPDHPFATRKPTLRRYAEALHLRITRRGRLHDPMDDALAEHGLERRVVATTPTTTSALSVVRLGECVVAVPERMCAGMIDALGLVTVPLPMPVPPAPLVGSWHQRYENDKAHRWLRDRVREALRDLG
ncbi:LysR family transcriptional regulator [Amycolatopsis sp. WQ 127309]|uniref:LysR family transcriptional regulator n=1 Tax=Amycolatopsis sp. WQ 127309 TaxID=2932773 RepID=UPI001FF662C2|nr:LysR family transcriptional regulator [Amycolatopsis sp. WQ 127309]UOZ10719.1 LysR family transcriptional regulator [Amycolatopsis sp. WQ 127309]